MNTREEERKTKKKKMKRNKPSGIQQLLKWIRYVQVNTTIKVLILLGYLFRFGYFFSSFSLSLSPLFSPSYARAILAFEIEFEEEKRINNFYFVHMRIRQVVCACECIFEKIAISSISSFRREYF